MPQSVTSYRAPVGLTKDMSAGLAYVNALDIGDEEKKRRRDDEITLYMAAADAQFTKFLGSLSSERHGANIALDIAGGATAAIGSVVTNAAPELAAAAGFIGNTKTGFNKELYFDRTLSALIVAMQTNRLKARAQIEEHMKLPAADYTLAMSFAELRDYEVAGSIDGAIGELNVAAAKSFSDAKIDYNNAIKACDRTDDFRAPARTAHNALVKITQDGAAAAPWPAALQTRAANLAKAMTVLGLKPDAVATDQAGLVAQRRALQASLDKLCTTEDAQELNGLLAGV
ncbi:MAG: hypothetical protein JWO16_1041 [Sphingomonas bacterium]|nr:hypothetical protein [Sphingomonas bacterium]